ncbi:hypothetical protein JI667_01795 [Bacillus sp. NTK074B]|nr:hypothetical protein [Bacillus sp. NTK074B]
MDWIEEALLRDLLFRKHLIDISSGQILTSYLMVIASFQGGLLHFI